MTKIFATVIIPTKNRLKKTLRAVSSASKIPHVNEIIVVDDGSDFLIDEYTRSIDMVEGVAYRFISNGNVPGAQGARVFGVMNSRNEIIVFLDSDDILIADGMTNLIRTIKNDSSISLVYGETIYSGQVSNWLKLDGFAYLQVLRNLCLCPFSGIAVRKSNVDWCDVLVDLPAWQDDELCLVASKKGIVKFVDAVCAQNFISTDSISKNTKKKMDGLICLLDKYQAEIVIHFGYSRIVLWKLRVLSLWIEYQGQNLITEETKKCGAKKYAYNILSMALLKMSRALKLFLKPFFDRTYV